LVEYLCQSRFLGLFNIITFASSFADLLEGVGLKSSPLLLNVILPVGISFLYSSYGLSYVIDIYLKGLKLNTTL
jgi:hypothetical protein